MFTRDQIEEIKKKLIMLGTKDTQFPDAHKLNGEEIIAIVQDGENKKIPLSSIINDDFINVSKDTTEILTLSTAVSKIDINNRKLGQVITFKDSANSWAIRQFTGSSLDNWNDISLWKSISGIDELKSQVETNAEDISVLSDEIERHDASILNLNTDVSKLKDKDIETSSSLSELNTKVDTLKSQADTNTSNISSLNTEVSTLRGKVDVNTTSISQINTELDNKNDEIAQINSTLAEHTESINANITTERIEDNAVISEKIATSAFDSTLSVSGKIAPADVVGEKIAELDQELNSVGSNVVDAGAYTDLDISDENGNVIMRLKNGHIQVKNFSSVDAPAQTDNDNGAEFQISDDKGNIIAEFGEGHIKTKNFDSRKQNICVTNNNIKLSLQGGKLDATGKIVCSRTSRNTFMNYWHTPKFIECFSITNSDVKDDETLTIFYYDNNFQFISSTTNISSSTPPNAIYMKLMLSKESEYITNRVLSITADISNIIEHNNTSIDILANFFSFEVRIPIIEAGVLDENADQTISKRHFDNGYIMLPPNYTPDGTPVKLCIFVHGTEGYHFNETEPRLYYDYLKFVCNSGYAVCDCSGMSDKYSLGTEAVTGHDCKMSPTGLACFIAMYDFVVSNYNVRTDGAYIFGKSAGGSISSYLSQAQIIPIRACAGLAPTLSELGTAIRWMDADDVAYIGKQFGVDDYTFSAYNLWNSTDTQKLIENAYKFAPYDSLLFNSDIDATESTRLFYNHSLFDLDHDDLWEIFNNGHKYISTPIKIWHAKDDDAVPYTASEFFKKLVDNGNGVCYIRTMPNGTGRHHAVDNDANALKKTLIPKYSDIQVTVPLAYAELVEWFDRY